MRRFSSARERATTDDGAPDESLSFLTERLLAESKRLSAAASLTRRWPSSRVGVMTSPWRLEPPAEEGPALTRSTLVEAIRDDRRGVCGIDDVGGEGVSSDACGRTRAGGDVGGATLADWEEEGLTPAMLLVISSSGTRCRSVRDENNGDDGGVLGMVMSGRGRGVALE